MKPFFVYLLHCADDSYYVGHTDELELRVAQHQAGEIDGYTHERRPVRVVWTQETATREEALAAERQIKGWTRAKKEALIRGDWGAIQRHAWGTRNPLPELLRDRDQRQEAAPPVHPEVSKDHPQAVSSASISQPERVVGQYERAPVHPEVSKDESLLGAIRRGERRAIAKAITLLESTRPDHRERADALLNALLPATGKAIRLGISGVPGVGKSTFIEALGLMLIGRGHRVAVLAIDPSSSISGGSILGDKTRMERLSVEPNAFIRPSPASGTLGGVAEKTREAMLVCEAADYDVVIVETVGVGQSETAVASMTDLFVLMQLPNAGDDLQAIKKGVMEIADLVVINKADLDPDAATRAQAQITSALRLFTQHGRENGGWQPQVMQLSALKGVGVDAFWHAVADFEQAQADAGLLHTRRRQQAVAWMWERIEAGLRQSFRQHPGVRTALAELEREVSSGDIAASVAARRLLTAFGKTG